MKTRVRCPFHREETASLVRVKIGWRCYGACQKLYTVEEVAAKGVAAEYEEDDNDKEDIEEKLRYIRRLPVKEIRGFKLPYDERGYYLVWPDGRYFKYRLFEPGKSPKYLGPKGYRPIPFWARKAGNPILAVQEGEYNSLALAASVESWDVISPGSASMFKKDTLEKMLTQFRQYSNIKVIVDDDAAGRKALIETKALFFGKLPFVDYILIPKPDLNDRYVSGGKSEVWKALSGENPRR